MADPSVTERSFPFASGQGANVTQDDWSAMAGPWQDNGVYDVPGGTALTVQPGPTQNTVQVNPGTATIGGFSYRLTAAKVLTTLANPGGSDRVDLVVLALDTVGQGILPQVVTSATVASVAAGSIPLAEWTQKTNATATSLNWGSAVDKRWFAGRRVRPAITGVDPPPQVGGLVYHPTDGATATMKIGVLSGGVPAWADWKPWGTTGAVVGTTDVQTLTNKTLTSPTITGASMSSTTLTSPTIANFTNANHNHSSAATGGAALSGTTLTSPTVSGDLPVSGNLDVAGNALGQPKPSNHNLLAWTYDPSIAFSNTVVSGKTLYLSAVYVPKSASITKIHWGCGAVASGAVAGHNFVGLYDSAGNLKTSANVDSSVTTANTLVTTAVTSVSLTPGMYWVAFLFDATTTLPAPIRAGSVTSGLVNAGLSAATMRYATNGAATLIALPATITPASNVGSQISYWAAIS